MQGNLIEYICEESSKSRELSGEEGWGGIGLVNILYKERQYEETNSKEDDKCDT
jgi:hypothetical protein